MKELVKAMKKAKAEGYNAFGIRVIENEAGVLNVGDDENEIIIELADVLAIVK